MDICCVVSEEEKCLCLKETRCGEMDVKIKRIIGCHRHLNRHMTKLNGAQFKIIPYFHEAD